MADTAVKVYYGNLMTLPDVSRVLACLNEKNVKFEIVNMTKGEHPVPIDFLKLQEKPSNRVQGPMIEEGRKLLTGSRTICRYFSEKYANQGYEYLLGSDPLERASIEQWLRSEEHSFDPLSWTLAFHVAFAPLINLEPERGLVQESERKLSEILDVYNQRLAESKFLAGNKFTLADLAHLPNSHYLANSKEWSYLFTSRKHVKKWWKKISERESWRKTVMELDCMPTVLVEASIKGTVPRKPEDLSAQLLELPDGRYSSEQNPLSIPQPKADNNPEPIPSLHIPPRTETFQPSKLLQTPQLSKSSHPQPSALEAFYLTQKSLDEQHKEQPLQTPQLSKSSHPQPSALEAFYLTQKSLDEQHKEQPLQTPQLSKSSHPQPSALEAFYLTQKPLEKHKGPKSTNKTKLNATKDSQKDQEPRNATPRRKPEKGNMKTEVDMTTTRSGHPTPQLKVDQFREVPSESLKLETPISSMNLQKIISNTTPVELTATDPRFPQSSKQPIDLNLQESESYRLNSQSGDPYFKEKSPQSSQTHFDKFGEMVHKSEAQESYTLDDGSSKPFKALPVPLNPVPSVRVNIPLPSLLENTHLESPSALPKPHQSEARVTHQPKDIQAHNGKTLSEVNSEDTEFLEYIQTKREDFRSEYSEPTPSSPKTSDSMLTEPTETQVPRIQQQGEITTPVQKLNTNQEIATPHSILSPTAKKIVSPKEKIGHLDVKPESFKHEETEGQPTSAIIPLSTLHDEANQTFNFKSPIESTEKLLVIKEEPIAQSTLAPNTQQKSSPPYHIPFQAKEMKINPESTQSFPQGSLGQSQPLQVSGKNKDEKKHPPIQLYPPRDENHQPDPTPEIPENTQSFPQDSLGQSLGQQVQDEFPLKREESKPFEQTPNSQEVFGESSIQQAQIKASLKEAPSKPFEHASTSATETSVPSDAEQTLRSASQLETPKQTLPSPKKPVRQSPSQQAEAKMPLEEEVSKPFEQASRLPNQTTEEIRKPAKSKDKHAASLLPADIIPNTQPETAPYTEKTGVPTSIRQVPPEKPKTREGSGEDESNPKSSPAPDSQVDDGKISTPLPQSSMPKPETSQEEPPKLKQTFEQTPIEKEWQKDLPTIHQKPSEGKEAPTTQSVLSSNTQQEQSPVYRDGIANQDQKPGSPKPVQESLKNSEGEQFREPLPSSTAKDESNKPFKTEDELLSQKPEHSYLQKDSTVEKTHAPSKVKGSTPSTQPEMAESFEQVQEHETQTEVQKPQMNTNKIDTSDSQPNHTHNYQREAALSSTKSTDMGDVEQTPTKRTSDSYTQEDSTSTMEISHTQSTVQGSTTTTEPVDHGFSNEVQTEVPPESEMAGSFEKAQETETQTEAQTPERKFTNKSDTSASQPNHMYNNQREAAPSSTKSTDIGNVQQTPPKQTQVPEEKKDAETTDNSDN